MADRHNERRRTLAHLSDAFKDGLTAEAAQRRLRVVAGDRALESEAGQVLVLTVARLLPRLCDKVDFICPTHPCARRLQPLLIADHFSGENLAALARLIWPDGAFTSESGTPCTVTVGIGGALGDINAGIGRAGEARLSRAESVLIEDGTALFSALSAAAIVSGEATKLVYPELGASAVDDLSFAAGPFGQPLGSVPAITLDRPFVAGVGAVGCALIYALICLGATGSLVMLDPDVVDDSNLMRYVLFDSRHEGQAKVEAAKALIEASGIAVSVEGHGATLQRYLKRHPAERDQLRLAVSAVDTYEARRDIAGELPREILNAGTMPQDFTVSRHRLADGYACLACLYRADPKDAERETVLSRELGLPKTEIFELLGSRSGLSERQLRTIAEHLGLPPDRLLGYLGGPLDTLHHKEFCATAQVATSRGEVVAPLAFGSAWAGFLLAAGIVDGGPDRYFRVNTLVGLDRPIRTSKRPRPDCVLCTREAIRKVYHERWGDATATV